MTKWLEQKYSIPFYTVTGLHIYQNSLYTKHGLTGIEVSLQCEIIIVQPNNQHSK